jgi:putative PIN family toxin of toxin-antitoxin system
VKVILDTNVFVSGVFFSGPPYRILEAWRDDKIQLVVSPEILQEYRRVGEILAEEHPVISLSPWIELVVQRASIFSAPPLPQPICNDLDDEKFLACALASKSKIIISGDKHLLNVSGYEGIEILKPRGFLEKYLE